MKFEFGAFFRSFDHRQPDPILDGTSGIEGFHLDHNLRPAGIQAVDAHQRRVSDFSRMFSAILLVFSSFF